MMQFIQKNGLEALDARHGRDDDPGHHRHPETTVQDLAKLLSEKGISGVPVVENGDRLVGIVSEGDLLHRAETGTERRLQKRRSWWLELARRRGGSGPRLCQGAWPAGRPTL